MKKFIIILLALMMILVSCDQQTPANNDGLMLGSPSNSGSDYDPYKDDFFRIDENGCLYPGNDYYNAGNRYWHMEEYESIEEVKAFRERVFNGMPMLKRVKLGTSIETIGERSFADIPSLISVEMKEGVKTIGSEAFSGNRSLEYIDALPKSLETIASDAFSNCPSLRLLCYNGTLDNWYKLGADSWNADVWCYGNGHETALYRFTKSGENYTLEGLTPRGKEQNKFILPEKINITSIADNTFKGVEATSIVIPETVTSIGESAFENSKITTVTIGNAVEFIGNCAFMKADIEEVTIPDSVKRIGYAAFSNCTNLKSVNLGSGIEVINYNTFEQCAALENITIPEGVKEIMERAFNGCSSLTTVTIPASVTSIGDRAFGKCPSLKTVNVAKESQIELLKDAGLPEGCRITYEK